MSTSVISPPQPYLGYGYIITMLRPNIFLGTLDIKSCGTNCPIENEYIKSVLFSGIFVLPNKLPN